MMPNDTTAGGVLALHLVAAYRRGLMPEEAAKKVAVKHDR
jgi:hypothetical protein